MDNVCLILNKLHKTLDVQEQFRRAYLFKIAMKNAGFTPERIREISTWIVENPSGIKSLFKSWVNLFEKGVIKDGEVEAWYEVANFFAYGGEVKAQPFELAYAKQMERQGLIESLERLYLMD